MSEKSPAVLQTNRNIWNFFQLYGDQRLAPLPVAPVWEICTYDYYLVPFQTIQDATQSLSTEQIFQHLFHDYFHPVHFSIWNILCFFFFFFMRKAFWKLDVTYIHYEMKIPHVFRMEKKIPSFQESFVSLLKTRVLAMRVILPNEKFRPCFSGL